jgi:hypothetical protein
MLGVMPQLLLVVGLVTSAAGLVLMAAGFPIREGTFDAEILTPGMIAAVGGLLLAGLGLAVRELRRIEQALASRPIPRVTRGGEMVVAAADAADAVVRLPIPSKPKAEPQQVSFAATEAATIDAATMRDEGAPERVRVKFPPLTRRADRPLEEATEVALSPQAAAPVEDDVAEVTSVVAASRGANGASGSSRLIPRPKARQSAEKANGSSPRVFWPVGPLRDGRATVPQPAATVPPPAATVPPPASEPPPAEEASSSFAAGAPAAPTILKTGVVEGMAYTLYSDGSIEAALPQGTLRFGSISALRDHIESTP